MTENKLKESIQIAEEIARELYTGEKSDSALLKEWKKKSPDLYRNICQQQKLTDEIKFRDAIELESALRQIQRRLSLVQRKHTQVCYIRFINMTACLCVLLCISYLLSTTSNKQPIPQWASAIPGNEKAFISTNNDTVTLDEKKWIVVGNLLINNTNDGKKEVAIRLPQKQKFIRLVVPAGGEQKLTLEDGTGIQVNTDSELLFPTHFEADTRQVKLHGEAYFDVTTNKEKPFIVQLEELTVEATGTAFNVKSYQEEDETSITLVKGSVTIYKEKQPLVTLLPGQLFTYHQRTHTYDVTDPVLSTITDWTNGEFVFHDETIHNIMRKLSRWYNVNIVIDDDIKHMRYTGILSRKQPLMETLEALRMTNELDFHLQQEKKIEVRKKENQH